MSCITQLLEMKGDADFLPIYKDAVIEGGGIYRDREYIITFASMGTRCGYVAITIDEEKIDVDTIDCHGGVTFSSNDHAAKSLLKIPCTDTWLGFDCAHFNDSPCLQTTLKYFEKAAFSQDYYDVLTLHPEINHRTFEYVASECKHIIDQLLEMAA